MTFAAKILGGKSSLLWLVQGEHRSRKAWWFLLVDATRIEVFKRSLGSKAMLLSQYGQVITSGYGQEPNEQDIAELTDLGFKLVEQF